MMLVAAISLVVGGLIATYAFQGRADAAAQRCPHKAIVQFTTALAQGASVPVPPGCTDALVLQLYVQLFNMSQRVQTHDSLLTMLRGEFESFCRQIPQIRC